MQSSKKRQGKIRKPSLSDQHKGIEENNKMGKTRDCFKKLEIPRKHFMQRWAQIRQNGMDLTEAEDIKKRWQQNTELYKKDLHDADNHDGVIDHSPRARHPGMRCQVGLRKHHYEKASGGDGIPIELF